MISIKDLVLDSAVGQKASRAYLSDPDEFNSGQALEFGVA